MSDPRLSLLREFADAAGYVDRTIDPLAADASFRRYFRMPGEPPLVLMDAPPPMENVVPVIAHTTWLEAQGFSVPHIQRADIPAGLLLIEDFGDDTFTRLLTKGTPAEAALYEAAVDVLAALHKLTPPAAMQVPDHADFPVPSWDTPEMLETVQLLLEWYAPAVELQISDRVRQDFVHAWQQALAHLEACSKVLVLRDYHVDNLMWLPDRSGIRRVGLIDFQDAGLGPSAYDLASLLQDARRDIDPALQKQMLDRYLTVSQPADPKAFRAAYHVAAAQRHTRVIGVFTRLWKRDGKPHYLPHMPRLWRLLVENFSCPALAPVADWFNTHIPDDRRITPKVEATS